VSLLLIPVALNWESNYIGLLSSVHIQNVASDTRHLSIIDLYAVYEPMLALAVLVSLLIRRELGLIITSVIAIFMMYQTMIYPMRVLYLLPYIVAIFAGAFTSLEHLKNAPRRKIMLYSSLSLLLAWNFAVSLIERPLIAISQKEARSPDQIQTAMADSIGYGPYRVLLVEWDVYYAARSLGWKYYKLFGQYYSQKDDFQEFLQSMDYVILRDEFGWMKETNPEDLKAAGFELLTTISFVQPDSGFVDAWFFKIQAQDNVYRDLQIFKNSARN